MSKEALIVARMFVAKMQNEGARFERSTLMIASELADILDGFRSADMTATQGTSACPICGDDTPHPHSDRDVGRWASNQVTRWGYRAVVVASAARDPHETIRELRAEIADNVRSYDAAWAHAQARIRELEVERMDDYVDTVEFAIGDRVRMRSAEMHALRGVGTIFALDGDSATVSWDSPTRVGVAPSAGLAGATTSVFHADIRRPSAR